MIRFQIFRGVSISLHNTIKFNVTNPDIENIAKASDLKAVIKTTENVD